MNATHNQQMKGKSYNGLDEITQALYDSEGQNNASNQFLDDMKRIANEYNAELHMEYEFNICETNRVSDFAYYMPVMYAITDNEQKRLGALTIEGREELYN